MPFVIFVVVFCVQSQIAVWALKRMRMIREHCFLPPLEEIYFVPYCSHSLQKGLTNQNPLSAHIFIDLRGNLDQIVFFCLRRRSQFQFLSLRGPDIVLVADFAFSEGKHIFLKW